MIPSTEYPKINTIFKRDEKGQIQMGQWSTPELAYLMLNEWSWSEKIDGTNCRVIWDGSMVTFGGKTEQAQMPTELGNRLIALFKPQEDLFRQLWFPGPVVLYGEGYGPGIQKGGVYGDHQDFILFDVRVGPWWLQRADVEDVAVKFGIKSVSTVGYGTLPEMAELIRDGGPKSAFGDFQAEGIVARPHCELQTRGGERLICKLKAKDFRTQGRGNGSWHPRSLPGSCRP